MPQDIIQNAVTAHNETVSNFFRSHMASLQGFSQQVATAFEQGKKLLICGNGGSTCDSLHIAGEFVGRFVNDRLALPAIALSADPGILTAVGNDYGFEHIFSRQIEAHGTENDILIAISTSGSSPNILKAIDTAKSRGLYTTLLTGHKGENKKDLVDSIFIVPSKTTARIQETHIMMLHLLAELVEHNMGLNK